MNNHADILGHFIERAPDPEPRDPEQERYEDQYRDTQALTQSITRQYDTEYLEAAAKIIEKQALEETQTTPHDGFVELKVKYAVRLALGLSPLAPIHPEEGEK